LVLVVVAAVAVAAMILMDIPEPAARAEERFTLLLTI
jgi:hypothetical protein